MSGQRKGSFVSSRLRQPVQVSGSRWPAPVARTSENASREFFEFGEMPIVWKWGEPAIADNFGGDALGEFFGALFEHLHICMAVQIDKPGHTASCEQSSVAQSGGFRPGLIAAMEAPSMRTDARKGSAPEPSYIKPLERSSMTQVLEYCDSGNCRAIGSKRHYML